MAAVVAQKVTLKKVTGDEDRCLEITLKGWLVPPKTGL
jgi:hypothetical protein